MLDQKHSGPVTRFLRKFKFELAVASLVALGLFLLWEKMHIKGTVWGWVKWLGGGVADLASTLGTVVHDIEGSDVVGLALILFAAGLVTIRIRGKIIKRHSIADECPKCAGSLQRQHRGRAHRILSFILFANVKTYVCSKCQLRVAKMKRKPSPLSKLVSKIGIAAPRTRDDLP